MTAPRHYTGQIQDESTGLAFYNARYYDAAVGRFISPDTIVPNPLNGQDYNRYTYVRNNPVNFNDPTGHCGEGDPRTGHGGEGNTPCPVTPSAPTSAHYTNSSTAGANTCTLSYCEGQAARTDFGLDLGGQLAEDANGLVVGAFDAATNPIDTVKGAGGCAGSPVDCSRAAYAETTAPCLQGTAGTCVGRVVTTALPFGVGRVILRRLGSSAPSSALDDLVIACLRSFSADTEVLMADGTTKPISEIEPGEQVWAHDPRTGEAGAREVMATWPHQDTLLEFTIEGGSVTTTEDHHFWNVTDSEWQETQHVDQGDHLLTADGHVIEAGNLDWSTTHYADAYDLTVGGVHAYFVSTGDEDVLVHNCNGTYV